MDFTEFEGGRNRNLVKDSRIYTNSKGPKIKLIKQKKVMDEGIKSEHYNGFNEL